MLLNLTSSPSQILNILSPQRDQSILRASGKVSRLDLFYRFLQEHQFQTSPNISIYFLKFTAVTNTKLKTLYHHTIHSHYDKEKNYARGSIRKDKRQKTRVSTTPKNLLSEIPKYMQFQYRNTSSQVLQRYINPTHWVHKNIYSL